MVDAIQSKSVLVTGGAGFLGSHVADALSAAGHRVTILDRAPSRFLRQDQEEITVDLSDVSDFSKILDGVDVVFHLAALADLNEAKTRPSETVTSNILTTVRLLESAPKSLERFVFASSVYVYSREGSYYRCSKQACESYIEEFSQRDGIPYTVLRFGSLYGPRTGASNGIYRLLKSAMTEKRIQYSGSPTDSREYIHVEDAARLSVAALSKDYVNQHLVLTGSNATRITDLFMMFSEMLGKEIDVTYARQPGEVADGHYSVTPYTYTPRPGLKMTSPVHIDMGQGVLRMIEDIDRGRAT